MSPKNQAGRKSSLADPRAVLIDGGYGADALRKLLGIQNLDDIGLLNHAAAAARIRDDRSAAAVLLRLLFLEEVEPLASVRRAIGARGVAALRAAGWVRMRGGGGQPSIAARLRVDPVGERFLLSDLRFRALDRGAAGWPAGDEVYPPSSDSLLLAQVARAPANARVLDLCTGSGVQALHHSTDAAAVVAVDLNPRAVAAASYNAAFNGTETIDVRSGDLYAPVRGQEFDLIVANPPFVTSPYERAPSFHSGGPTGDRVLRRVIRGWRDHLAKDGSAFAVSHVGIRRGETIEEVAGGWFRTFPGRALVAVCETGTAVDLAAAQALFALRDGLEAYRREVDRWHAYLRRHRIAEVSLILVVARNAGRRGVEVIDARPRILPLPLTPGPAERIEKWLTAQRS